MKSSSPWVCLCLATLFTSCAHNASPIKIAKMTSYLMSNPAPVVGKTVSGQDIYIGGLSGLIYLDSKEGALFFNAITDRGPNGWAEGIDRPFLLPEFSPQIITLKTDPVKKSLEVVSSLPLKKKNREKLTGLPNKRDEENPTDLYGYMYSVDPLGLDTEALTRDAEGGYWVGDEYAPSLVHFNSKGVMTKRLVPGEELPKIYKERRPNRGFEGIALVENKLFGFMQSPLKKEESVAKIVEVNLDTLKTSAEYLYPFEPGNDKIGDAAAIGKNTFLVIEQNGKIGTQSSKLIFKITLSESDHPVTKTLIADLKETPFNNIEKVEGLTVINNRQIALTIDNDFQINSKTDKQTGITPLNDLANQILIIDFNQDL